MWLIEPISKIVRWFASLARRMVKAAPIATVLVTLTTLLAQVFQLFAMLLPLKVILLMGSDGIPRFFPEIFQEYDRSGLVMTLSATAIALYAGYLLMQMCSERAAAEGAETLDSKNQKLPLFPNQHAFIKSTYRSVASATAGLVFSFAACMGIIVIYPKLGLSLLTIIIGTFAVVALLGMRSDGFRIWFFANSPGIMDNVAAIGLFFSLALLVSDYLSNDMPSLLIAIISILLARQLLSRLPSSLNEIGKLNRLKLKIDSLFQHGVPFDDRLGKKGESIFELLLPDARRNWLSKLLTEVHGAELRLGSAAWIQMGIPNVLLLRCACENPHTGLTSNYFVKIYPSQKQHLADHEITLLSEEGACRLCPELIHASHVDDRQCLVFEDYGLEWTSRADIREHKKKLLLNSIEVQPSVALTKRFGRSRNALPQRLRAQRKWLSLAAQNKKERHLIAHFEELLPFLRARLEELPLYVRNPDMNINTLMRDSAGDVKGIHWARWSLEPIGADWPIHAIPDLLDQLKSQTSRNEIRNADPGDVHTAALLFEFDKLCNRQKYADAISLIAELVEGSDLVVLSSAQRSAT